MFCANVMTCDTPSESWSCSESGKEMVKNLTARTLHGLKWSYLGTVVKTILQIGVAAIMARLLDPTAFGLIAMAGVILRFGQYFSQMGVGSAMIQKKEISDEDVRASFTSAFLLGITFTAIGCLCAPLGTYIFDNEKIVPVIRIMALSFLLSGLSTTAISLLRRNFSFGALAVTEIFSYVVGYGIIGVLLAYNGFGVWSLVVGALSQSAFQAFLAYLFCQHRLSLIYSWKYYKPLYSFGGRISVISFFEFIGSNLDTLAIGHFFGAASLGVYNRASMLVNLPAQYFTSSFSLVLFPSFSKVQMEIERLKKAYLSTIMIFSAILLPTCLGMAAASREIVLVILGEKWIAAFPVLQILAIAVPFNLLSHFGGILCEATATLNIKLFMQVVYLTVLGALFYLLRGYGIFGFAAAFVIGGFCRFAAYAFITKQICKIRPIEYFQAYLPSIILSLIIGPSIYFVASLLREFNISLTVVFLVEIMIGLILLVILFFYGPQRILRQEVLKRLNNSGIINNRNIRTNKMIYWFYKTLSTN
ncbi:MAG: lipopolysaccharide biosynthesis protein [Nitrospinales bacterium]